jgi:hypothetical protein
MSTTILVHQHTNATIDTTTTTNLPHINTIAPTAMVNITAAHINTTAFTNHKVHADYNTRTHTHTHININTPIPTNHKVHADCNTHTHTHTHIHPHPHQSQGSR